MTTEHSPAVLIGEAAAARIAELQETLHRLRERETCTTTSRASFFDAEMPCE